VLQQRALADARLAAQDQHPALAGPRGAGELVDAPDLVLPSEE
jgi:hypothetical protein